VAGDAGGDMPQPVAQRPRPREREVAVQQQRLGPAHQGEGDHDQRGPHGVAGEVAARQVRQAACGSIGDSGGWDEP
jgi:hypothetical protein